MGELAARARLAKQTMTTLVRLAERDGLVRRERDESDRRAFRIFLTARSTAFRPVAERVLARLEARVERRLSPAEREVLTTSLQEVMSL